MLSSCLANNVIFLQLLGCPQGGPGSLGFSMVGCIYYEHQFRCSIYDHLAFMFFFRYFDDVGAVVVHRSDITTRILPCPSSTSSKTKPTIPQCLLYLKNVHKIPSNFLKKNLSFKWLTLMPLVLKKLWIVTKTWKDEVFLKSRLLLLHWW